jgi:hypothetical protein
MTDALKRGATKHLREQAMGKSSRRSQLWPFVAYVAPALAMVAMPQRPIAAKDLRTRTARPRRRGDGIRIDWSRTELTAHRRRDALSTVKERPRNRRRQGRLGPATQLTREEARHLMRRRRHGKSCAPLASQRQEHAMTEERPIDVSADRVAPVARQEGEGTRTVHPLTLFVARQSKAAAHSLRVLSSDSVR